MMMKESFCLLLVGLLCCASISAQKLHVSGQIDGPDGRVPNVSVREIDDNRRIYNHTTSDTNGLFSFTVRDAQHSLQFYAPGYRTISHKMLGIKSFRVHMDYRRTSPYIGHEKLIMKSDQLLCGKYMGTIVRQMAWVEQMNDTLFTLILPVQMDCMVNEYPAGRTLLVLDYLDQQLMQWQNVADVYPIQGDPDAIGDSRLAQSYVGISSLPGGTDYGEKLYAYPHFQFTLSSLEWLCANPDKFQRMVVDTYKADNYWNFYTTGKTAELLQKLLNKVKE